MLMWIATSLKLVCLAGCMIALSAIVLITLWGILTEVSNIKMPANLETFLEKAVPLGAAVFGIVILLLVLAFIAALSLKGMGMILAEFP